MAGGRVDIGGGSKSQSAPSRSTAGGSMSANDKVKLGLAVGALVIGGLVMAWYFGAFDAFFQPKLADPNQAIGGTPVTAEQKAEYDEVQKRNYEEMEKAKEGGATSAGS
jgi:hypothetical protein